MFLIECVKYLRLLFVTAPFDFYEITENTCEEEKIKDKRIKIEGDYALRK